MPAGERGEIVMRGPKVFKGYWRDPDATATAFAGGWFHTGDIGVRDDDGYLFIVDRLKDMIVSGGENIAGSEVERVLYEHDSVLEVAVVGRPDDRWGEVPVAFVVLRPGATATADELVEHCRAQLARFKVPKEIMFLDALPRNPSGKVLKRELRDATALSCSPVSSGVGPASGRRELQVQPVGRAGPTSARTRSGARPAGRGAPRRGGCRACGRGCARG